MKLLLILSMLIFHQKCSLLKPLQSNLAKEKKVVCEIVKIKLENQKAENSKKKKNHQQFSIKNKSIPHKSFPNLKLLKLTQKRRQFMSKINKIDRRLHGEEHLSPDDDEEEGRFLHEEGDDGIGQKHQQDHHQEVSDSIMTARIQYPDLGMVNLEKGVYILKIT